MTTTTVDARGVLCPVPIIRLARAAAALPPGAVVALLSDDPAAEHDVPAWCRLRGHTLLAVERVEDPPPSVAPVPSVAAAASPATPAGLSGPGSEDDLSPDTRGAARAGAGGEPPPAEPVSPNPAPGQVLRHLIRLGGDPSHEGPPPD